MISKSNHHLHQEKEQHFVEQLEDTDKLYVISSLKQFFLSCFGPRGKAKYIKNRHGALMALSSSSLRIISNMTFVSPISQIVMSSIQQHLNSFSDNGLWLGVFILSLIEGALRDKVHHVISCEVNTILLHQCMDVAEGSVFKVDLANVRAMLCLVRGIFQSKRPCCLTSDEVGILSSLVLQILTSALPDHESEQFTVPCVEYVVIAGRPVTEASLVKGVLLDMPKCFYKSLSSWRMKLKGTDKTCLKVAMFNTSLDIEKVLLEGVTLEASEEINLEEYTSQRMMSFVSRLQKVGVNIVGCQKVIHPSLVKILSRHGILCLEKLSILHIEAVQKLTGACLLSSMDGDIPVDALGQLEDIDWYEGLNRRWLHLKNGNRVTTVILCHRTGTCLDELKHVFNVAYHVASLAISNPEVVPGAGHFEALLSSRIHGNLSDIAEEACARLHCSRLQFNQAADVFLRALEGISKTLGQSPGGRSNNPWSSRDYSGYAESPLKSDLSRGFEESVPGFNDGEKKFFRPATPDKDTASAVDSAVDWDSAVVDLLVIKMNALKMAVEMANMILSIGTIVGQSKARHIEHNKTA